LVEEESIVCPYYLQNVEDHEIKDKLGNVEGTE
jgi:hypothetical protein